ncbi:hypothetical protein ACRTCN_23445, partial [Burkholderia pseudomallei]
MTVGRGMRRVAHAPARTTRVAPGEAGAARSMASRMPRRPAARALRADPAQAGGTRRAMLLRHRVHAGAQRRSAAMEDRRHRAGER